MGRETVLSYVSRQSRASFSQMMYFVPRHRAFPSTRTHFYIILLAPLTSGLLNHAATVRSIIMHKTHALTCRRQASTSPERTSQSTGMLSLLFHSMLPVSYVSLHRYYGHNGDDCISIINGARNVLAQNGYCGFSSHGLSIGSLGKNGSVQTVQGVVFRNWTMDGAVYGARVRRYSLCKLAGSSGIIATYACVLSSTVQKLDRRSGMGG